MDTSTKLLPVHISSLTGDNSAVPLQKAGKGSGEAVLLGVLLEVAVLVGVADGVLEGVGAGVNSTTLGIIPSTTASNSAIRSA